MGVTQGKYANNILTFKDSILSPATNTTPFDQFPSQTIDDPGTGFAIQDHFFTLNDAATNGLWQVVKGTGGSIALATTTMGWLSLPTAASLNDYASFFTQKALFAFKSNLLLAWEVSVNVTEANTNTSSWWAGLTSTTSTGFIQNSGVPPTTYSGAVIYKTTGGLAVNAQTSNSTTQHTTSTAIATVVSAQSYQIGMALNPNDNVTGLVTWYVSTVASNLRTFVASGSLNLTLASLSAMYFGFGVNTGSSNAETLTVDYARVCQGLYYQ